MKTLYALPMAVTLLLMGLNAHALTSSEPALEDEHRAVVFLAIEDLGKDGDVAPTFCNGTMVSETLIVTAAHCVRGNYAARKFEANVEIGEYVYKLRPSGERVRVGYAPKIKETFPVRFHVTKALQGKFDARGAAADIGPGEDVAVIELLKRPGLPEGFPFASVISQAHLAGVLPRALDYWPTVVAINPFEEPSLDSKRKARLNVLTDSRQGYLESKSSARVQPGDSGSPIFFRVGTEWKLAGVTKGRADSVFSNWDVFPVLDAKICEIVRGLPAESARLLCRQ